MLRTIVLNSVYFAALYGSLNFVYTTAKDQNNRYWKVGVSNIVTQDNTIWESPPRQEAAAPQAQPTSLRDSGHEEEEVRLALEFRLMFVQCIVDGV